MSAFINPEATEEIALSRCYCPGQPHANDSVVIRSQYGYGDLLELSSVHANLGRIDPMAERAKLLEIGIRSWTFVDEAGKPVDLSIVNILLLSQEVVEPIVTAIDRAYARSAPPLPNASGARSQPSSRASSGARKTTRRKR